MKTEHVATRYAGRRHLLSACAVIAIALTSAPALSAPASAPVNGWGVPLTDVMPDPAIRYGKLANGMKYAILRNGTPKGAASVRLQFDFGSIGERDNERGLAHFIEHMAFNGSTHVPEGDMVKILERQGLKFGPDTNAQTDFDTTTYMLDLPKADAEHVDTALFLFRETASEVKFDPAAVDRERGVILGEERARDSFQLHQAIDQLGFQLPDTPYPRRIPIGVDEVLKTATADTIRDLYHRYYRPENATLVFVGDADPVEIEAKIREKFADWKGVGPAGAPLPRGTVDLKRPASFDTFTDPAVATTVDYTIARDWQDPADTLAERRSKMIRAIAIDLFNQRLTKAVNAAGSPLLGGGMLLQDQKDAARLTTLRLAAKDGAWKEAVEAADQELRRALQYGFTAAELKTGLANSETAFRTAAEQANTRTDQGLAGAILNVADDHDFVTTPQFRYQRFQALTKTLTLEEVNAAFKELWTGSAPLAHVSAKQALASADVQSVFEKSRAVAVAAPKDSAAQAFAYDSFGMPGKIAADTTIEDLGVRTIRFANNVKLNIKKTDFEAGKARFVVRLGNGQLDLPKNEPGLAAMMTMTSSVAAVKKHSLEDLKELAAGRVITLGTAVGDDAFVATGATTPNDLGLQMKVSAAYLLDPGFRPEAASKWADVVPVIEKQVDAQPQTVAGLRLPIILAAGDQRFGLPATSALQKRNFDEARAALTPILSTAPIEITVVGDVDEQAVIKAVADSFGALPARKLSELPPKDSLSVAFRKDRSPIELTHEGSVDQALVETIWPTTDDSDFRQEVGLDLLQDVLNLMLTESVREKLGDSYGVSTGSMMSDIFPGYGYFSAAAVVAPDKTDEVQKAIADAAAELRSKPIPADLLARARNPELEQIDKSRRENGFWLASLAKAQSEPERLDRIRKQREVYEAITPAELQKLARKYLSPETVQSVRIVSSKVATTASK